MHAYGESRLYCGDSWHKTRLGILLPILIAFARKKFKTAFVLIRLGSPENESG